MLRKVVEAYLAKHERLRKEAEDIMGGTVIPYEARTFYIQGKGEGIFEGRIREILDMYNDGEISLETAVKRTVQYGIADEADFLRRAGSRSSNAIMDGDLMDG